VEAGIPIVQIEKHRNRVAPQMCQYSNRTREFGNGLLLQGYPYEPALVKESTIGHVPLLDRLTFGCPPRELTPRRGYRSYVTAASELAAEKTVRDEGKQVVFAPLPKDPRRHKMRRASNCAFALAFGSTICNNGCVWYEGLSG